MSSPDAAAKAQFGNEAGSLQHPDGSSFRDVDNDPVGGGRVQEECDDAVVTGRRPIEDTLVATDGDALARHRSSSSSWSRA